MRTLPAYYIYLLIYILIAPGAAENANLFQYTFFLQNFAWQTSSGFFGVSWSLTIEEGFYLLLPICFVIVSYMKTKARTQALSAIALIFLIALAAKIYFVSNFDIKHVDARKFMVLRIDAIGFGVLFTYFFHYRRQFFDWLTSYGIALILPYFLFRSLATYTPVFNSEIGAVVKFSVASLTLGFLLPWAYNLKSNNGLVSKFVSLTSEISYSLYLCHIPVIILLNRIFGHTLNTKPLWMMLVYIIASYGFAYTTYRLVERTGLYVRDNGFKLPSKNRTRETR